MLSYRSNAPSTPRADGDTAVAPRPAIKSRWAWKKHPPNCEECGDWGSLSNPDPYGSPIKCACGANPFKDKPRHRGA